MDNNSSDTNYSDENAQYNEWLDPLSSENTDILPLKESQDDHANAKTDESLTDKDEKVAEKVEGGYLFLKATAVQAPAPALIITPNKIQLPRIPLIIRSESGRQTIR